MIHRIAALSLSLSLSLVACGDDAVPPLDALFEPLCGEEGPVALMELDGDEVVRRVARIGASDEIHVRVGVAGSVPSGEPEPERRNVVIDECGHELAQVASGADSLMRWGDALIGCIDDDLVWLSGYDDPSPTRLAQRGCWAQQVGERWVVVDLEPDATVGRLLAIEPVGAEVLVHELLDEVLYSAIVVQPMVIDGEVFAQTTDLAVHRIDPSTGATALELEQAEPREWSIRGTVLAYQAPFVDPDEPSPRILRDRTTGAEQTLDPDLERFGWLADGLFTMWSADRERWFRLDPLRELDVPEGLRIEASRDDGSLWLAPVDRSQGETELLLWREGEAPQSVWSCVGCRILGEGRSEGYFERLMQLSQPERREVWRFDHAGGPPRMLGNASNAGHLMDDDRVLTVLVDEDAVHGSLTILDEHGEPVVTLASDVARTASAFTLAFKVPGDLVYEARNPDGTSTLLRARHAP